MSYNVTIDDISPLITYTGQWLDSYNLTTDPFTGKYLGETFHSSQTNGSQASFSFNGTAVYIFGAKRGNHGYYSVAVDDNPAKPFDGSPPTQSDGTNPDVFQTLLFAQTGLSNGMHTVVLRNDIGTDATKPFVDIDFITWTSNDAAGSSNITIDDRDFIYKSPNRDWGTYSSYLKDYYHNTEHLTDVFGANATLTFEGSAIYLYGGTLDDHGGFNVTIDDRTPVALNGSTKGYHAGVLLYYADGLGPGQHRLIVTNTDSGRFLDIDSVNVTQSNFSEAPESSPGGTGTNQGGTDSKQDGKIKTPVIAGLTCGLIILAVLAAVAVWYFKRRQTREREYVDLIDSEVKSYDVPPAGYGPASSGPGWSRFLVRGREPWANDPVFVGVDMVSYTNTNGGAGVALQRHGPNQAMSIHGPSTMITEPSTLHGSHSSLTLASESNAHAGGVVPSRNIKGRPPVVQQTEARTEMTEEELRVSRMRVPDRPQDWGPVQNRNEARSSGTLPPDYNQAIEPFAPRQPHA